MVKRSLHRCGAIILFGLFAVFLLGCASPGLPSPPSLQLPNPVQDLTAQRVGNVVELQWTMPEQTTDDLDIKGKINIKLCRFAAAGNCVVVGAGLNFPPGAKAEYRDSLPPDLLSGPAQPLKYTVQLQNAARHSAGDSNMAISLRGLSVAVVNGLLTTVIERGVLLQWKSEDAAHGPAMSYRIERDLISEEKKPAPPTQKTPNKNPLVVSAPEETHVVLRATPDAAQTGIETVLDATAKMGESYRYRVQRVLTVNNIEAWSDASPSITVALRDVFPPRRPVGLEAVFDKAEAGAFVDLSWTPNTEEDLAGYIVYRRDLDSGAAAVRISPADALIPAPGFHDAGVLAGHRYVYTVSAVDKSGNESKPSVETVQETK